MTTDRTSSGAQPCELSRLKRRQFLVLAGVAGAGFPCIRRTFGAGITRPVLSIGLIADPQYADKDSAGTRFYRQSVGKLESVVSHFNRLELAFCVNLGDLIDREWKNYDAILEALAASRHRFHHVLGNHDFEVSSDLKARVPARLGLAQRFHAIERAGWCFVMLDTTDVSLYAHPESTPEHAEAAVALKRLADTGAANAQTWNSALGGRQLRWFDAVSKAAANEGRRVIVF
ncbi:MAG TPA: metallophosphoesterase, partial [Verrucomicrobiota bacterium]|nr:metallophosphoesterase [Verrucomicrobiota bacterium]